MGYNEWGFFREGLKGILKELGLKVERYIDYDTEGTVFGRPEQIDLDIEWLKTV